MYLGVACVTVLLALWIYSTEPMRDVQASHISANVPSSKDFERFLQRDLGEYFSRSRGKPVFVEFEWLRHGPTQSGMSFPKFYLWIHLAGGESPDDRGAVRVAAVEQNRFNVTDFISERVIRAEPEAVYRVFPGPVCERIKELVPQWRTGSCRQRAA
jgi:hypothetical protein